MNRPSAQDANGTPNFIITTNNRINLALFCQSCEINCVLL